MHPSPWATIYNGRPKIDLAKDIVAHMNQTIPPLDYRAGLVAFGSGSCLDDKDAKVLYGLTSYRRAELAAGLIRSSARAESAR